VQHRDREAQQRRGLIARRTNAISCTPSANVWRTSRTYPHPA
jgi:hypothetical protein